MSSPLLSEVSDVCDEVAIIGLYFIITTALGLILFERKEFT